jgi:catechol 2,3-dioxygenase-like lactoylglutathione lyase family enzyme
MTNPIIKVSDIAFPRFSAPDLDRMERFLVAFGMQRAARTERGLYMRGTASFHHVHVTHAGEPGFVGLAFAAATRGDLDTLARAVGGSVEPLDEPGGGEVVRLRDPDGRRIEVVSGMEPLDPIPVRAHPPLNTGADRPRIGTLQRVPLGPAQVKRCGHAALKCTDFAAASRWYQATLGLLVSDEFYIEGPDQPIGRFLRCDRGADPADHHTLLLLTSPEAKLGHVAWEVADFDDLMAGRDYLDQHGDGRPYWGVGRHVLGGQIFDYWKDPIGFTLEHWTDSDLLRADAAVGTHYILDALKNQWGPLPPPDLDV